MARILVIEDEQVLRTSMVRGLSKLPGVTVEGVGTLGEALAAIDALPPDLVFSDLDLPDRSGIELVGELAARRLDVPLVYISAYLKAYGSQIPPNARVRVLEKPVELGELRDLVRELVGTSGPPDAAPPFGVVDYVQLAAMGGHSVRIQVEYDGSQEGEVVVHRGEIWSAEDPFGSGRDALFRLLVVKPGSVECGTVSVDPGVRNIEGRTEELLLEAARIADEDGRGGGGQALEHALDQVFDTAAAEHAPDDGFSEAMERGLEAMLEKDYVKAVAAFEDARQIRPEDRIVEANLIRLREMGFGEEGSGDS